MSYFNYDPLTEEEVQKERQFALLEPGTYDFTVTKATFSKSQKGNPMIELQLLTWDNEGKERVVFDYLVSTAGMNWKIRHFCEAVGLKAEYEARKFSEDLCPNARGRAIISIQKGKQKPDGSYYKDKNVVDDYVILDNSSQQKVANDPNTMPFDDALPF